MRIIDEEGFRGGEMESDSGEEGPIKDDDSRHGKNKRSKGGRNIKTKELDANMQEYDSEEDDSDFAEKEGGGSGSDNGESGEEEEGSESESDMSMIDESVDKEELKHL